MELRENRTELERLLGDVWDYEDVGDKKTSLPKWLFALTLTGAVVCTLSPSDIIVPVMTALAPAPERLLVDNVSSEKVGEDLDYRIAEHTESLVGWRAFLEAHPDGPHAQAARAEINRLPPTLSPQPEQSRALTQTPDDTAHETAALSAPPMMIEEEPAPPPQPVEVAELSSPSPPATQTPVDAAQAPAAPAPPVKAGEEPAPPAQPVEVADQVPPSSAATQAPVQAAQSPAAPAVMAEEESGTTPPPVAVAADAPLPPSRPREIAAAKSAEPARPSHLRAEHRQASEPNVLTILVVQLFHRQASARTP
jgi:hypothetical protein